MDPAGKVTSYSRVAAPLPASPRHTIGGGERSATLRRWPMAITAVALFTAVLGLQWLAGAFGAEFASDAAGHYVSGLLIHDYVRTWPLGNPIQYLIEYHSHFPIVGIGTWPPLYYTLEAAWMLATTSTSQPAMIVLSGSVTALVALLLAIQAGQRIPAGGGLRLAWGLCAGLAFVSIPVVQVASGALMLDTPVTLMCMAAVVAYARFLDTERLSPAILFGVFAAVGLLIKGGAGCLALVPLFALLLGRRLRLLAQPAFWAPAAVVLMLAGPWYLATHHRSEAGFAFQLGPSYWSAALRFDLMALLEACGPLLTGLAVVRMARLVLPSRQPRHAMDVSATALALSVIPFHLVVPVDLQARYMMPAMAAVVLLAFNEAAHLIGLVLAQRGAPIPASTAPDARAARLPWLVAMLVLAAPILSGVMRMPPANHSGMIEAVRQAIQALPPGNPVVLLAADPEGEAEAIADMARLDPNRPSLFAVRGSRIFGESAGGSGYLNTDYQPRFERAEDLQREIDRYGIPLVLFRRSRFGPDWAHLGQLEELMRLHPERWERIGQVGEGVLRTTLYRIRGNEDRWADPAALRQLSGPRSLQ